MVETLSEAKARRGDLISPPPPRQFAIDDRLFAGPSRFERRKLIPPPADPEVPQRHVSPAPPRARAHHPSSPVTKLGRTESTTLPACACQRQHSASEMLHPFLLPHRSRSPTTLSRNALRRVVLCPSVPRGRRTENVRRELRRGEWTLRRLGVPARPRSLDAEFGCQQMEAWRQDNEGGRRERRKARPWTSGPAQTLADMAASPDPGYPPLHPIYCGVSHDDEEALKADRARMRGWRLPATSTTTTAAPKLRWMDRGDWPQGVEVRRGCQLTRAAVGVSGGGRRRARAIAYALARAESLAGPGGQQDTAHSRAAACMRDRTANSTREGVFTVPLTSKDGGESSR
ncbi:hypothetical protein B0H13DRAFT_2474665 [Mycena leptocephala]|nr:hypothetical protein B0H13DRAFT_2474665 [Mycena leptocephala]